MRKNNAATLRRLRAEAALNGLCTVCRCRSPRPGNRNCDHCIARTSEYKKGAGRAADLRRHRDAGRRRRAKWRLAGLCIVCGKVDALEGSASCRGCLETTRARVAAHYQSKRAA